MFVTYPASSPPEFTPCHRLSVNVSTLRYLRRRDLRRAQWHPQALETIHEPFTHTHHAQWLKGPERKNVCGNGKADRPWIAMVKAFKNPPATC